MSEHQTGLANFGTNTSPSENSSTPDPELIRTYDVTGRLVTNNDTKETAPQREDSPFTLSIHHYPIDENQLDDHRLFRVCFGADQHAWFDIKAHELESISNYLKQYGSFHTKMPGAHFTTANGEAEFTKGTISTTFELSAVRNTKMVRIQLGDTVGAGATVDMSPAQLTDLQKVMNQLTTAPASKLTDTDTLPVERGIISVTGENTHPDV